MYRLLTERKNIRGVRKLLVRLRLDYSMFFGVGGYCLSPENTMAIELDMVTRDTAREAAREIGLLNRQEAVLIQEIPIVSELVRISSSIPAESPLRRAWTECLSSIWFLCRAVIGRQPVRRSHTGH